MRKSSESDHFCPFISVLNCVCVFYALGFYTSIRGLSLSYTLYCMCQCSLSLCASLSLRAEGGRRRGYMGHLTRIANSIVHNSDKGPNGVQIQQLLSGRSQCRCTLHAVCLQVCL